MLFSATSKPGSGSFVRPRKVTLGYSFIEALIKVRHIYSYGGS